MPQVSRRKVNKVIQERIDDLFLTCFTLSNNRTQINELLFDLLTPTERIMLAKRFSVAFMLIKGYDYSTIRETLKVSNSCVSTVAKWLMLGGRGFKRMAEEIEKKDQWRKVWEYFTESIEEFYATSPGLKGSRIRSSLRQKQRQRAMRF